MNDMTTPEKSPWGWKALIIAIILSFFFMLFFYLAMTNEADYMPSNKKMESHQTAFKNSPVMSQEALDQAEKNKAASQNDQMQMSDEEMKHMQDHENGTEHTH